LIRIPDGGLTVSVLQVGVAAVVSACLLVVASGCSAAGRDPGVTSVASNIPPTSTPVVARAAVAPRPTATSSASAAGTDASELASKLQAASAYVDDTIAAVNAGDVPTARAAFAHYSEGWESIEDGVKARSPAAMATIEDATDNASAELRATLSTQQTQLAALQQLREILNAQVVNLR
jgi:hypothetical protein